MPQTPESISLPKDSKVNTNPFTDIKARDWLANLLWKEEQPHLDNQLILMGDGPFEASELASFLSMYEIECNVTGEVIDNDPDEYSHFTFIASRLQPIIVTGHKNFHLHQLFSLTRDDKYCRHNPTTNPPTSPSPKYWLEQLKDESGEYLFIRSLSLKNITVISQEM